MRWGRPHPTGTGGERQHAQESRRQREHWLGVVMGEGQAAGVSLTTSPLRPLQINDDARDLGPTWEHAEQGRLDVYSRLGRVVSLRGPRRQSVPSGQPRFQPSVPSVPGAPDIDRTRLEPQPEPRRCPVGTGQGPRARRHLGHWGASVGAVPTCRLRDFCASLWLSCLVRTVCLPNLDGLLGASSNRSADKSTLIPHHNNSRSGPLLEFLFRTPCKSEPFQPSLSPPGEVPCAGKLQPGQERWAQARADGAGHSAQRTGQADHMFFFPSASLADEWRSQQPSDLRAEAIAFLANGPSSDPWATMGAPHNQTTP